MMNIHKSERRLVIGRRLIFSWFDGWVWGIENSPHSLIIETGRLQIYFYKAKGNK